MPDTLTERYRRLIERGAIQQDSAQALAVEKLQLLSNRLANYAPPEKTDFLSFFTRRRGQVPKGLYLYGGVGRGKTMLMDLFAETAPVTRKRRVHFHEFMGDVHARLNAVRLEKENGDALLAVAGQIAKEVQLLCLDELFVIDIADATILNRLFGALLQQGVVLVATSNVHPADLYKDGWNRDLFLPFIDLLEDNLEVFHLEASQDFRLRHLSETDLLFIPVDAKSKASMDNLWTKLTFGEPCAPETLEVLGHKIHVPCASMGTARFAWGDLFQKPLGPQDYLALARQYQTIFLDGIPVLSRSRRDEARRFITFIDELYDHRTGLVASAEDEPDRLYQAGDGADHFQRTASRMIEMRAAAYLAKAIEDPRSNGGADAPAASQK